ncbi:MAG: hypothetical protein A2020_07750 [Lentisphaerae bacterium GWF2_45_14]|nr:MAG: hypothetical protein A2020_07750 [Lentisphaerae bacterium GWF2_45_14]
MREELRQVQEKIDDIIRNDDFPASIRPESLKEAVRDYPCRGGKRLRPALLTWSCGLLGGDIEKSYFPAAAVEIYHNWTLVHDDIIDNDDFRRGLPTAHKFLERKAAETFGGAGGDFRKFGTDFAILAGDIMQGWAMNMLLKSEDTGIPPKVVLTLSRKMQTLVNRELISGEALDVEFSYRDFDSITQPDVLEMIRMKTGILLRFCATAGAAIALESSDMANERVKSLGKFASLAGVAFQLRDDWLGIFGEESKFGKPVGSDLREKKPTMLIINALGNLSVSDRSELLSYMGHENFSSSSLEKARILIRCSGAERTVEEMTNSYIAEASGILSLFPDNKYRQLLFDFLNYLTDRKI